MAALSISSESSVKTVRLTYQELLELANILYNEKKEKSPKSKSKENLEENESRVLVSPSKDERTNVDKDEGSEAVVLETKTDSKKAEKRTKEQKKSSKKKVEEKKKHRSRSHSDEKHSGREDDDEVGSHHNKEKREKTTKAEKTQNDSAEVPVDVEVFGLLKGKEEKKTTRKRSPKLKEGSGEKTADLENHVAKLRLDGEEEERKKDTEEGNSRKFIRNIEKKTKSSEERDKKHPESKRKYKKKSDVVENSNKDSCEESWKEKEKRKRKNNIKIDDNCFEDEHKKQGILKSSPKAKGIHVSFSEDIEDPHSGENNNALRSEERGLIRIPEGIDIHQEDGKIRGSTEFEECLLEIDYHHHDVDDVHDDDDESISQTAEISHDLSYDKDVHHHDNPDVKPIDEGKMSTMEKRLKALNRQRAQQLIKQCHHAENSLSNLLSKGISDKGSLHRVCTLSKEIQDLYQGVIMLDLGLANQHDVDQLLWKNAFYQVIETFRKYGKLFLGYSNQKNMMSPDDINKELYQFLQTASFFYSDLLGGLQKTYHFEVQDIVSQPRKAEMLGRNAKLALLSCHHILIFLGDIERYKEQLHASKEVNWGAVRTWYLKASKLAPKNGKPYNQLAVIAVYANRKLDAVYYYVRSLAVSSPILTAKEKLTTIFHEIQRKADQVQQEEEMQRRQQERQRTAHDRRDTHRGHGRNIFKEAAREVGLVNAEKEPNNTGRHEIWVFMRQGKCRRLILTNQGKIQPVDATGTPITKEHQQENNHRDPIKESPKISLQEVNKKFMLHFLCAHGLLYTRISMERLPSLQVQLIGELHTLLGFPQCSSVSYISLLQMSAINMYAIDHTAPREKPEPFVRVGTPQDQALTLAIDMLISVLNACTELLMKPQEDDCHHGNGIELSATLRQFIPAVKVWFDWLNSHQNLWQASSISIHRKLWESIAQFTNLLIQHGLPELEEEEDGEVLVTLREDEFLAGFKLLADAKKYSMTFRDPQLKELAEDHLHIIAIEDFCRLMSSIPNPTLQYCQDTEQYTAVITSIPASQPQNSSSVNVHMDVDHQTLDHQESYESDDVIIESVLEDVESGDEADKGFKELKAKKEKLAKELEDHKEKHSKARAVVHENVSRPHLMSENYPTYLVPDTNCFIDQLSGLQAIVMTGDFTLVVPLVVINELDGLKKDLMIDKYHDFAHAQMVLENSRAAIDFLEDQFSLRSPNVKAVTSKGTVMDTIAFRSEDTTARKGNNDDVILSCCLHYCQENFVNRLATADQPITIRRKVVLLTDDRNLRVKAYTRNVPVLTVPQFRQMARL